MVGSGSGWCIARSSYFCSKVFDIICVLITVRLKLITVAKQLRDNKAFIKVTKTYVFACNTSVRLGRVSKRAYLE